MHIPDGFVPLPHAAAYWLLALPFVYLGLRWSRREMDDRYLPTLASLAALVFALQAVNIPIPGGTSGHLAGATLVAVVMGSPWAAVLVLTLVLTVQALVFADGGVTTLGLNVLNLGVIGGFVGYYSFRGLRELIPDEASLFAAAWLGLLVPAVAAAFELAAAGTFPLAEGIAVMGGYHALIGLVAEGLITVLVVRFLRGVAGDRLAEVEA